MDFMITICADTKERSLVLFPVDETGPRMGSSSWSTELMPRITRDIFAETISDLISIWLWIWER